MQLDRWETNVLCANEIQLTSWKHSISSSFPHSTYSYSTLKAFVFKILTVAEGALGFCVVDEDPPLHTGFVDLSLPYCQSSEKPAVFPLIQKTVQCVKHSHASLLF